MKKIITLFFTILLSQIIYSQDYQIEFQTHCETQDTINQLKVLKKWQSERPKDPELFVSFFNYHFMKSRKEVLSLTGQNNSQDGLVMKDSLGKTKGFISSQLSYDEVEIRKGLSVIEDGIKLYPDRLDMRFGKVYVLGQIQDWQAYTKEIIKTVQRSSINKNQWAWPGEEDNGEENFLLTIQDYQVQLYNTGDDSLLKYMREIATEILKYYPTHVPSLSNISITYLIAGEYEKGIEALKRAEKINPSDFIVLSNIAHGYKLKGDKANAIEYYKKVIKHGDEKVKAFAKQQITDLKQ